MLEPPVTVIVLTWNSRRHIDGCLTTMLKQTYPNYQILVVDSCSSDGTPEYIRTNYPEVEVVELSRNMGYRRGNAYGMQCAKGEYIVVCNDDVEVERMWLAEMVKVMEEDDCIGIVTPMILLAEHKELVNSAGNTLHFSGMYGPRGKGEPKQRHEVRQNLAAASGCCFMIRRDLMHRLGGFSTDFDQLDTGWHASFEDVDLSWRAQLMGCRIEYVPASIMYHKYKQPDLFPSRFGSYEWGRYLTICRNYSLSALLMLVPFLVVLELMAWAYAISKGRPHVIAKARVMWWLIRHPRDIWTMRQRVQATRTKSDLEIVSHMSSTLSLNHQLGGGKIAKAVDSAFGLVSRFYYRALLAVLHKTTLMKIFTIISALLLLSTFTICIYQNLTNRFPYNRRLEKVSTTWKTDLHEDICTYFVFLKKELFKGDFPEHVLVIPAQNKTNPGPFQGRLHSYIPASYLFPAKTEVDDSYKYCLGKLTFKKLMELPLIAQSYKSHRYYLVRDIEAKDYKKWAVYVFTTETKVNIFTLPIDWRGLDREGLR